MSDRTKFGVNHPNLFPSALLPPVDPTAPEAVGPRTWRDWFVDSVMFLLATLLGLAAFASAYDSRVGSASLADLTIDVVLGGLAALALWWRRRWPIGIAAACVLVSAFSAFAGVAATIALFSLAVHRPIRTALAVGAAAVPASVLLLILRPQHQKIWVEAVVTALIVAAVVAWGAFVRARRQLVWTLRERVERAEADQLVQAETARTAERTRIAREMHDVLAHRISLVALHAGALELRPDLPAEQVRETAALLRETARQALEELRGVIGVLREGGEELVSGPPQPTLADIPRLVAETRRTGAKIDFEMTVADPAAASSGLGRDAYRIVQEALTNIGKHAQGTATVVRVSGSPADGLLVSIRNRMPLAVGVGSTLPGAGAGLLGLHERVTLAGGSLRHGADGTGDFVVAATLPW
jgi:signal transduction histidine kinase